jgi:hypothetical protein
LEVHISGGLLKAFLYGNPLFLNYVILISRILFFPGYYSIFRSPLPVINSLNVKKALCFRLEMSLLPVLFCRKFSFPFSYPPWQVKFLSFCVCSCCDDYIRTLKQASFVSTLNMLWCTKGLSHVTFYILPRI